MKFYEFFESASSILGDLDPARFGLLRSIFALASGCILVFFTDNISSLSENLWSLWIVAIS